MAETALKDALDRFQSAISRGDGAGISAALNEVENLLGKHRAQLHPQLVHFLEGRSYAKAHAWLGGSSGDSKPANPPGGCSRHA